jgi:glycosyltransferase involved in cell wall biosynthesis
MYVHPYVQKNKFLIKHLLGTRLFSKFANFATEILLDKDYYYQTALRNTIKLRAEFGITIAGHITAESGTGEAVRSIIKSVEAVGIPYQLVNFERNIYRKNDTSYKKFSFTKNYSHNIIVINADQIETFYNLVGNSFFEGKYNIAYWLWEQSNFPKEWTEQEKHFDEVWTASDFSKKAIEENSSLPVTTIPLAISNRRKEKKYNKQYYAVNSRTYVFLFIFDFLSVFERKNPMAIIQAFNEAFSENENASLIIKMSNSRYDKKNFMLLKSAIKRKNIKIIDTYISRDEISSLLNICDCYISLHRSEGFGYTIFEAMKKSKPVIATGYSGNIDYMNKKNSFPVKYNLTKLLSNFGDYKKNTYWADPDISDASKKMRFVYENRNVAKNIGKQAKIDIQQHLSPYAVGKIIKQRIMNTVRI